MLGFGLSFAPTAGSMLAIWVPVLVLIAAIRSMHATAHHDARVRFVAASWPLSVAGFSWLDWLSHIVPEHLSRAGFVTNFHRLSTRLDVAAAAVVVTALLSATMLSGEIRDPGPRRWRWTCRVFFAAGLLAFIATRNNAHDADHVGHMTPTEVWSDHPLDVPPPPADMRCGPLRDDALEVMIGADEVQIGGTPQPLDDLPDRVASYMRYASHRDGSRRMIIRFTLTNDGDPRNLQRLRSLFARYPIEAERRYVRPIPSIRSRSMGTTFFRGEPCVVPWFAEDAPERTP